MASQSQSVHLSQTRVLFTFRRAERDPGEHGSNPGDDAFGEVAAESGRRKGQGLL